MMVSLCVCMCVCVGWELIENDGEPVCVCVGWGGDRE